MTTKKEQEDILINLRRSKVSELFSRGYTNQAEIARALNVSEPTISRDVQWFRQRAKENFLTFLQEKMPEEFDKAITSYDYIIRTASYTAETTHDDRIKLQALHEVRETRAAKMDLISNIDVMSYQMNKDVKGIAPTILQEQEQKISNDENIEEEVEEQEQEQDNSSE